NTLQLFIITTLFAKKVRRLFNVLLKLASKQPYLLVTLFKTHSLLLTKLVSSM
ncbi:heavy metal translocating P-type ATPase family protein, partial [Vibrio parahaemolyticus V-223/04]